MIQIARIAILVRILSVTPALADRVWWFIGDTRVDSAGSQSGHPDDSHRPQSDGVAYDDMKALVQAVSSDVQFHAANA